MGIDLMLSVTVGVVSPVNTAVRSYLEVLRGVWSYPGLRGLSMGSPLPPACQGSIGNGSLPARVCVSVSVCSFYAGLSVIPSTKRSAGKTAFDSRAPF